ncbi:FRG domain-containing protein [Burkholderia gladioli]|uniref:FRG domain-containing protein n=1 Tax=Burkholderia gladioli TaxID=28095 RepID=UPI000BBD3E26|nr:FRG domain-containing protein [Burkholderia gladioli]ATF90430.1 FRG domain-containing protein [Burkholderia gladioli pv. gladioli]MBJ9711212.1 FRG domain-containing protein [Burkholderia gladioli]MCH7275170.1 FRG domain-containing protein [Burkholderia gladioli]MDN7500918.1 FRG domain-containing protein [Burkholderia gladioli]MDR8086252.1 FRG domain-containing protein [Burkholderia gladioli]
MREANEYSPRGRAEQHIATASSLAGYLQAINRHVDGGTMFLFRGQRQEEWMLKPSIARHPRVWADTEEAMLAEFRERAIPYLESTVDLGDVDWLAIAQHHNMPTRLLDWSGSALAALWFAIHQPTAPTTGRRREPGAAVWILRYTGKDLIRDEERASPFSVERTPLLKPRHVSRRIAAQDGWFSLHRGHVNDPEISFVSLDTNQAYKDRLHYVRIPASAFGRMRAELKIAGMSRAVLFPDLEGVAGVVTAMYLYPDDEIPIRLGSL